MSVISHPPDKVNTGYHQKAMSLETEILAHSHKRDWFWMSNIGHLSWNKWRGGTELKMIEIMLKGKYRGGIDRGNQNLSLVPQFLIPPGPGKLSLAPLLGPENQSLIPQILHPPGPGKRSLVPLLGPGNRSLIPLYQPNPGLEIHGPRRKRELRGKLRNQRREEFPLLENQVILPHMQKQWEKVQ